jgi:hypothetical protein
MTTLHLYALLAAVCALLLLCGFRILHAMEASDLAWRDYLRYNR